MLGETHKDETTHDVELAIVRAAKGRADRSVILGLEMFARDAQPSLDAYLASQIGEAEFLAKSRPWGNYKTGYRALVEHAKASGIRVIGTNLPPALRRKVSRGGSAAVDALAPAERKLLPPTLRPNSKAYWSRYDRLASGHLVRADAPSPEQRLHWGSVSVGQHHGLVVRGGTRAESRLLADPRETVVSTRTSPWGWSSSYKLDDQTPTSAW